MDSSSKQETTFSTSVKTVVVEAPVALDSAPEKVNGGGGGNGEAITPVVPSRVCARHQNGGGVVSSSSQTDQVKVGLWVELVCYLYISIKLI